MTSSRKKHHPAGGPAPAASIPTPARSTSTRTWVIRVLAVLGWRPGWEWRSSELNPMSQVAGASCC